MPFDAKNFSPICNISARSLGAQLDLLTSVEGCMIKCLPDVSHGRSESVRQQPSFSELQLLHWQAEINARKELVNKLP